MKNHIVSMGHIRIGVMGGGLQTLDCPVCGFVAPRLRPLGHWQESPYPEVIFPTP